MCCLPDCEAGDFVTWITFDRSRLTAALAIVFVLVGFSAFPADLSTEQTTELSGLDSELVGFVTSGEILKFLPRRQLQHEIATRDSASLNQFVRDLMAVATQMGYDSSRDMGAIPLNLNSDSFNGRGVPTPAPLRKIKRAPGPFGVHRYLFPESGVPTFAGADVAIYPEDLVAGKVDVAIIGVPSDMGSGRRNAEYGPRVMRALNTIATPDSQSLVDPMEALRVVDYGDFAINNMSVERSVGHVTAMVAETRAAGAIPMLVGGDTSVLYPGVKGIAQVAGRESFGLVHFSAHPDVERAAVHTVSDTQSLYLLLSEKLIRGKDTILIGLRGEAVDESSLRWLREQKVRYHTMVEIRKRGFGSVLKRVMAEAERGPEKYFVSIDVSAIEPTEMVAAGRIAADGLHVQEIATSIRQLCALKEIVGFELTDMAPMLDHSRLSAVNANTLLNACLVGIALRKEGLKPDYVHPLVAGHGQR